jgi:transposase
MPHTRPPYSPEFRRQMVDLVHAGRDPADLAREFQPSEQAIRDWVAQSDRREGRREEKSDILPAADRDELIRLRRENKQLRLSRALFLGCRVAGDPRAYVGAEEIQRSQGRTFRDQRECPHPAPRRT